MASLLLGLRFLHFLSMALWIAGALRVTTLLRSLTNDPSPDQAARIGNPGPFGHIGAAGILITGLGMIIVNANMGVKVPWPIHASFVVALVLWGVQIFAERGLAAVTTAIASGHAGDDVTGRLRTYRLTTVVFHVGWTALLAVMVFRNLLV